MIKRMTLLDTVLKQMRLTHLNYSIQIIYYYVFVSTKQQHSILRQICDKYRRRNGNIYEILTKLASLYVWCTCFWRHFRVRSKTVYRIHHRASVLFLSTATFVLVDFYLISTTIRLTLHPTNSICIHYNKRCNILFYRYN